MATLVRHQLEAIAATLTLKAFLKIVESTGTLSNHQPILTSFVSFSGREEEEEEKDDFDPNEDKAGGDETMATPSKNTWEKSQLEINMMRSSQV
jgi:hypothetical protein